ncbi:MAG TPA: 3-oxoadipate enol-lactonase [Xanthobacteraceae bacterium]|nr:3-oxoadipate enol-lactonase [Xanthobacteraceae bacterium]
MPVIEADGCPLHVEIEGDAGAPVLMLGNSLGTDLHLWDDQAAVLARQFRIVRYDQRGHGKSDFVAGRGTIERFGRDALAVMDTLGLKRVHWCGLSMGGMVGQWLAAQAPQRIGKLVLANTSSYFPSKAPWDERIRAVRERGLEKIADGIMKIWFTDDFIARAPAAVARMRAILVATPVDGYIAACEAIRDMDHRELLSRIEAPTLVIGGRHDRSTPLEAAEFIRSRIPGAALTLLDAAHISNVEQTAAFNGEVLKFLTQPEHRAPVGGS